MYNLLLGRGDIFDRELFFISRRGMKLVVFFSHLDSNYKNFSGTHCFFFLSLVAFFLLKGILLHTIFLSYENRYHAHFFFPTFFLFYSLWEIIITGTNCFLTFWSEYIWCIVFRKTFFSIFSEMLFFLRRGDFCFPWECFFLWFSRYEVV